MDKQNDTNRVSSSKVTMPSGGGALRGISEPFKAQLFTGSGGFSIPFPLPDARGFSPVIDLTYNSGSGNGLFGLGFSVSLDSIVRKTSNGIPRYDDTDVFILDSAGELLPKYTDSDQGWAKSEYTDTVDGITWTIVAYRPRIEGAFSLIERWTDLPTQISHWKVVTADNITHFYGVSEGGRIYHPDHPHEIFQWLIEKSYDPYGNKILYHYKPGDRTNIPDTLYNTGRDFTSARYPDRIQYGNYFSTENNEQREHYAFEVIFDYGERDKNNPDAAPAEWTARPDPFSSYKSGFEIGIARRCAGIYLRHSFTKENNGVPFTTAALLPDYDMTPVSSMSIIKRIVNRGYRMQAGRMWIADEPAPEFSYQGFNPLGSNWQLLQADAPDYLDSAGFIPVDLNGIGIDGLLYSSDSFTGYLEPLGNGQYAPMRLLDSFPIFSDLQSGQSRLTSLNGNNVLDLVVSDGTTNGFFEQTARADWQPFQPFDKFPKEYLSPEKEMTDLSGTGRSDLLLFDNTQLKYYPSEGKTGFAQASYALKPTGFPATVQPGAEQLSGFSDFFGDGLSHRYCLRNGSLTVWPCLGHGRFGEAVNFANAPFIDGLFDTSRVFLIDADGSGATDIVYCYPAYARIWFNRSGHSFSDPADIVFPATYSDITAITAGDVSGYGTTSLIFTVVDPLVKHLYYDFSNQQKPYLLQRVDNGVGGLSELTYTTSVIEQLRDKQEGRIWPTRLPIAVSVVNESKTVDQITGAVYTQRYRYHDGYFDTTERVFRGFGYVENWDTETYEQFQAAAAPGSKAAALLDKDLWMPPIYTKSWFITGAYEQTPAICQQYENEFYQGDSEQWCIPAFELGTVWNNQDASAIRQAYGALAGQTIRSEVYGEDQSNLADHPYTVSMSTVQVRLIQPRLNGRYCSVLPVIINELSYAYDRVPEDPRISQNLVLRMDPYGHPLLSAAISFPRRSVTGAVIYPEQQALRIIATEAAYINTIHDAVSPEDTFWQYLGINWQTRSYEIGGISAPADAPFTEGDLRQQVQAALRHPKGPLEAPTQQPWSRLLSWTRNVYWNDDGDAPLPYGETTRLALLHHAEAAVLDPDEVTRSFGDKVNEALLSQQCGYVLSDGYWWNYGQMQLYNWTRTAFYQPSATKATITDLLPASILDENGFNGYEKVAYDAYYLMVTKTSSILSKTISLDQHYRYDYQAMSPVRAVDANNNISEVLFDPLGQVIATTIYGQLGGADTGDLPMDQYIIQPEATFGDIIAHPDKYLQGATTYFYYDRFAWKNKQQPLSAITVTRTLHVHQLETAGAATTDTTPQLPISIVYSDGMGAVLQSKATTTPGESVLLASEKSTAGILPSPDPSEQRWLISGYIIYNNKGMPVEQYQPYFSATPYFEDQQKIIDEKLLPPPTVIHYDPIGRVIRTDSPKGFFSKSAYTPWETSSYDFNDTIIDSPYYKGFTAHYPADPEPWQAEELHALNAAVPCYNTPAKVVMDNLGNPIRTIACNLGAISPTTIPEAVATPMTPEEAWNGLLTTGYLARQNPDDSSAWVTAAFQPYQPGFHQTFLEQFPENGGRLEDYLAQSCMTILGVYDAQGRQLYSADPRLFLKMVREDRLLFNFRTEYGLNGQVLQSESADAGIRWTLSNMAGNAVRSWDSRGLEAHNKYDNLQRPTSMYVSGGDQKTPLANLVQATVYGETTAGAADYNLMGKPYQDFDESGLSVIEAYSLDGAPVQGKTYLRPGYKTPSNWTEQEKTAILSAPCYTRSGRYNVQGQVILETLPDGSQQAFTYDINGLPVTSQQKTLNLVSGEPLPWQTVIRNIQYNAIGKRTRVEYGNGVVCSYTYDTLTQQLIRTYTTRNVENTPQDDQVLQDISYSYDPAGHTVSTTDQRSAVAYYKNQKVAPRSTYRYDPIYRIISAQGRTLPGLNVGKQNNTPKIGLPPSKATGASDLQNLENYTQRFSYDFGDNLILKRHLAASGNWSQVLTMEETSNRLDTVYFGNPSGIHSDLTAFRYDQNGNLLTLSPGSTATVNWNYLNHISSVVSIAREITDPETGVQYTLNDAEYYQYNISGDRVRKVTERAINGGTQIEYTEKIYLGSYQEVRSWTAPSNAPSTPPQNLKSERHTVLLNDGAAPALITHIWAVVPTGQSKISAGDIQYRFQLCDPLDSVTMEVTETGELLSFEQYYVYGGTSFILARSQLEADSKELRFCGKEKDATTGLYYYGARYYAPWLSRWMSPDPAGPVDGTNLYEYVSSNPVNYNDPTGMGKATPYQDQTAADRAARIEKYSSPLARKKKPKKPDQKPIGDTTALAKQADLRGKTAAKGTFYPVSADPMNDIVKRNYVTKGGKVYAQLKVNGKPILMGANGSAKSHLTFRDIGTDNQKGKKINFHAEDWVTSSFRDAVEKEGGNIANSLVRFGVPNRSVNTGKQQKGKDVFSLRINYSPCLGCVETIKSFNEFLHAELGEAVSLRVKFLKPYQVRNTLTWFDNDESMMFLKSIKTLQDGGIPTRLQPIESAEKMYPGFTSSTADPFETDVLDRMRVAISVLDDKDDYPDLDPLFMSWKDQDLNRKEA
ncbi:SpvB/TcaC N-terminal domain-containing protein [Arachidicoccus terrestris]|uniref:SpvB/TcaC N-terminal domain-containing protein n=1 Tax=Arachidicoccus terrestris TaxID=2875539 RepID=UPI001CC7721B|nr:SpvB/TcaC N-terminal domain-containing protein [Arachidicoccus terrestris]UAY55447.1 hypothetical protein K9M52_18925 [Arachidicoccus terrestris]